MQRTLQVSLLVLQALNLVHARSSYGSSIKVPIFGIREQPDQCSSTSASASTLMSPSTFSVLSKLRGGRSAPTPKYSTWSDQVLDIPEEFSVVKPGDGSQEDPDGIPKRYLIAHKDNRSKAKEAFEKTQKWRQDEQVSTILANPHPQFQVCHEIFPVFLPGRDKEGHLIMVQKPGKVRLDIADEHEISEDEVLRHYLYIVEYIWNLLDPSPMPPNGLMTSIIDCDGVGMDRLNNKQFRSFGKKLVAIMSNHYPTRSYKTLIINAPRWIKLAFNLVKPLMRESTRKKVTILNKGPRQDEILKELLGCGDTLPSYLSSSSETNTDGPDLSDIEQELRLVASVGLKKSNSSSAAVATS